MVVVLGDRLRLGGRGQAVDSSELVMEIGRGGLGSLKAYFDVHFLIPHDTQHEIQGRFLTQGHCPLDSHLRVPHLALVPFFIDWMDSVHPAKTAPRGGSLVKIEVVTPVPDRLRGIYKVLGLDITIASAPVAGFCATIDSQKGRQNLRMFNPVPRGFVI